MKINKELFKDYTFAYYAYFSADYCSLLVMTVEGNSPKVMQYSVLSDGFGKVHTRIQNMYKTLLEGVSTTMPIILCAQTPAVRRSLEEVYDAGKMQLITPPKDSLSSLADGYIRCVQELIRCSM